MAKKKRGDKIESTKSKNLEQVINEAKFGKQPSNKSKNILSPENAQAMVESKNMIVEERLSNRIFQAAKRQQEDQERGIDFDEQHLFEKNKKISNFDNDEENFPSLASASSQAMSAKQFELPETSEHPDDRPDLSNPEQLVPEIEINEEDNKAFEMFMHGDSHNSNDRQNKLEDLLKNINSKFGEITEVLGMPEGMEETDNKKQDQNAADSFHLPPELVEVYTECGLILSKFRSTNFPKAFREIPLLRYWEEALFLTRPDNWTAATVREATKMFVSTMSETQCQRAMNLILLPRVRDEIQFYKKLNFHIYEAIMKAVFKPMAFFRGFLLPLCNAGNCTLKEATIISAVLREKSIPMKHTAVAMIKIAEMNYTGSNSIFLRTLIEKKYNLPYRALDALVFHFLNMKNESRKLPVLWHQCFLSFVRIYAKDIPENMRKAMISLTHKQHHAQISAEIREALMKTLPRDIEIGAVDDYMNDL